MISHLFLALDQLVDSINRGSVAFFECGKAFFYYGKRGHCSAKYLVSTFCRNFVILFGGSFFFSFFTVGVYVEDSLVLYCVEFVASKKLFFFV